MPETKWTPGPWTVIRALKPVDGEYDYGINGSGRIIAEAYGRTTETERPPAEANANLIAAAPDLYEALAVARGQVESWCHTQGDAKAFFDETLGPIVAALYKARGEK